MNIDLNSFKILPGKSISLKDFNPADKGGLENKKMAQEQLKQNVGELAALQYRLYAENRRAVLIILQAMDAAGKDGLIRHVMSGINPQGCDVHSFKHPSVAELEHDFIWRHYVNLPDRGRIGIFNRSHYENVLITKVHPELLLAENLPGIRSLNDVNQAFWATRYRQINNFEQTISENGMKVLKFFLHLSKEEQKLRFLKRIEKPEKNWKLSSADLRERACWDAYQEAYETAISQTSTDYAPWYIIPADHKWLTRAVIGNILVDTLQEMDLQFPDVSDTEKALMLKAKKELQTE